MKLCAARLVLSLAVIALVSVTFYQLSNRSNGYGSVAVAPPIVSGIR